MGLLEVGFGAAKSVLEEQWREYFYCPALADNVLVKKGENRKSKRSFNTKGSEGIISNGSIIAVNEGQCMLIVDQGGIVEVCAKPGEFVYDTSLEPSIFYGNLKESIIDSFKTFGKRFSMGGDTGRDQRVYFINTKYVMNNPYGTPNPVPFRVVDQNVGLDIDIAIRCNGEYVFQITDPILFYKNVSGNVDDEYTKETIAPQLKSDLLTALQPAFAKISEMGIRYSALPAHADDLANVLNEVLSDKWGKQLGIEIVTVGVNSATASKEDEDMIKELQRNAAFRNPTMAAAQLVAAQSEAMKSAAANENAGPMMAFAGMNMAGNAGGMNAANLFAMGQQQAQQQPVQPQAAPAPTANTAAAQEATANGWTCSCGASGNSGKFCAECGASKPADQAFWTCSCGTNNKGKFCMECGTPKPAGVPQYKCDKCGWEPADPKNPPKFCPECGDPFDDGDIVK